ncbi:MAG: prepilin-type N-terminal cleavage/methylation domain-containing protein [Acidobacteria bacterium]|nr:prepilin-type N-terminal cleavage/methylation domain-containing protein [Acidobacteriota bacterium]
MQDRGFSLIEVLVAMGVLCVAALGAMQFVAVATGMMSRARTQSLAATLASARMEQLRALRFEFDAGERVTDLTTNLSTDPPAPGGGGLAPSGSMSLDVNIGGFFDFLDDHGRWLSGGGSAPGGTAFVRRWSVEPADAGGDLLVLQVLVRPAAAAGAGAARRVEGEARYTTLRARVVR